jgi:hypothetical protein
VTSDVSRIYSSITLFWGSCYSLWGFGYNLEDLLLGFPGLGAHVIQTFGSAWYGDFGNPSGTEHSDRGLGPCAWVWCPGNWMTYMFLWMRQWPDKRGSIWGRNWNQNLENIWRGCGKVDFAVKMVEKGRKWRIRVKIRNSHEVFLDLDKVTSHKAPLALGLGIRTSNFPGYHAFFEVPCKPYIP